MRADIALQDEGEPETISKLAPSERELAKGLLEVPSKASIRHEAMIINEVSLLLAEKRTALSVLRTGLAVLVLPASVLSVLIAISRYYDPMHVIYLLAPLLGISFILSVFGVYLIVRSWKRTVSLDHISLSLKRQNAHLNKLLNLMDEHKREGG
jgi:hypothetical protein